MLETLVYVRKTLTFVPDLKMNVLREESVFNESFNNFFLNLMDKQMINQVIKRYIIVPDY